jgi:Domain of unknown function DUF29
MYMRAQYERDFYAWTQETARLIEKGRLDEIDWPNVAEEIRSLGLSDQRELKNRLRVLMAHLLKRQHQPEKHTKSWDRTITEQRLRLEVLLEKNPTLKRMIPELLPKSYKYATLTASNETGLALETFPEECPFTPRELLTIPTPKRSRR